MRLFLLSVSLLLLSDTGLLQAEVRLPRIFTDHMVLQREQGIAIWGWDDPGQKVKVTLGRVSVSKVTRDDGTWRIVLPAAPADGKAHQLIVKGSSTITLEDVVLGEVWFVGGQSNMNRSIDVTKFDDPNLRMFWVDFNTTPNAGDLNEGVSGWAPSTSDELAKATPVSEGRDKGKARRQFSEVGYVFAQKLREKLGVPVGVIKATVGGSTAQAWTPKPDEYPSKHPWGTEIERVRYIAHKPGLLYHCMVDGLVPFSMHGVIWYQGEDDGRNKNYAAALTALVESYRKLWNNEALAFHMCQIAQTTFALGDFELEEIEHHIADGIAARDKGTDSSDEGSEEWPGAAREIGDSACQRNRHGLESGCAAIRIDENLHHGHREDESRGRGNDHVTGLGESPTKPADGHAVEPNGDHTHQEEN